MTEGSQKVLMQIVSIYLAPVGSVLKARNKQMLGSERYIITQFSTKFKEFSTILTDEVIDLWKSHNLAKFFEKNKKK